MADYIVHTVLEGFTGESAGVEFTDGTAEVSSEDNPGALLYFQGAGYKVEPKPKRATRAKTSSDDKGD